MSIVIGCPSMAASASMPPTPQPSTPKAVNHGRVRIGADERCPGRRALAVDSTVEHDAAEILEIHLVHDAGVRRHDAEVFERRLAPAQERIAFLVAVELDLVVEIQRVGRAVTIHLHRMVDDELGG